MTRSRALMAAILPMTAAILCAPSEAQVFLRGQTTAERGTIVSVSADGVRLKGAGTDGNLDAVVTWDMVRRVEGPKAEEARKFADFAEKAWRARTRLERADVDGAEPIFEELARELAGKSAGHSGTVVYEGLCRCRLARGARGAATLAWLDWVQATAQAGAGVLIIGGRIQGAEMVDRVTGLVPGLPPICVVEEASGLALLLDDTSRWTDTTAADLAMLYRGAARYEAGMDPQFSTTRTSRDSATLVRDIVLARAGSTAERNDARKKLTDRLDGEPRPWVEAWCRIALGRSLLRDDDEETRRRGLVQMLHVPARLDTAVPGLAAVAVGEAAAWCAKMGDAAGARALKGELSRAYPNHAANGWVRVREIAAEPNPTPGAQQPPSDPDTPDKEPD